MEDLERIEQAGRASTRRLPASREGRAVRAIAEWKLEYFARQYGAGKLSLARAAREAGVSLREFQSFDRDDWRTTQCPDAGPRMDRPLP